jgi:radical SAM protein with 4Fe4S-binding SPASM domain
MKNITSYDPGLVVWEITLNCNLKCRHCGSSAGMPRDNELTTKEGLQLCNDLSELGFKGVTLFGGEPFLRDDWFHLGREIKDLGMKLSVVTNGFVDAESIIPDLVKLDTDSVQVGIDGASDKTHDHIRGVDGSFENAKEFLRLSKKAGLPFGAITTVSKMNFMEIPAIRDLIIKEGFDWQVQEAIPIGRFSKKMVLSEPEYYALGLFIASNQKKYSPEGIIISGPHNFGFHSKYMSGVASSENWNGCLAGKTVLGIQSDGNVKGCLALSDDYIDDNIRARSIIDIWNDPTSFAYNRNFLKEDLGELCKDCKYGRSCKGGCTTRSISLTGKFHNDSRCFYRIENNLFEKSR